MSKTKRVGFKLDMTPMVDVGFLLLTFFMLTTQFKPPEDVEVTLPTSHSAFKLPDKDVMVIIVDDKRKVFLGVDSRRVKEAVLAKYATERWNYFDEQKKKKYQTPENMAIIAPSIEVVDLKDLPQLLINSRLNNPRLRTVIKADRNAEYGIVEEVMNDLQKTQITRFNLVTDVEKY